MAIIHADKELFNKMIAEKKTFMVDFFATWCGPCKMLGRVFETIEGKNEVDIDIVKVDIDQEPELAQKYNVTVVPTLYFIVNGEAENSMSGFIPENVLLPKLKELAAKKVG
ncbi:thioredoxin family protein [Pectinatus frisingensis]|uniref:thioredoxin family protein n=1 Tax=Pectinatus frisingensis TaxID=865 RepID=UPI0015F369C1|nr:thioredoxin family protein [Pectinatus frisingensis]